MKNTKYYLISVLLSFHFFLVLMGAFEWFTFIPNPTLRIIYETYADYTGANTAFKFFAPNVSPEPRALFEITTHQGEKIYRTLDQDLNTEAELKMGSIVHYFNQLSEKDKMLKKSFASSLVGKMFARYPQAKEINLRMQDYILPSMDGWRKGERPYWQDFYLYKFRR